MKIHIPEIKEDAIGGGWSFTRNFLKSVETTSLEDCDIFFITGATLVQRDTFKKAKELGKKIVLRADGIPEDWRNRGTGWSRFRDYAKESDLVIYQSTFLLRTIGKLINNPNSRVIYNGVDKSIFKKEGDRFPRFGNPSILYVNYRKGENNKRVEEAIERFRYLKLRDVNATLTFVGNFPKTQFFWNDKEWDFGMLDYENKKDWQYLGIIKDREKLAKVMRSCDYIAFPSFADPCPNTLIEALECGCEPLWINDYGGQHDIVSLWKDNYDFSKERMVKEYLKAFNDL